MALDLIGELNRRDPFRDLRLARHLDQIAAARWALPIIGRQFVTNLDDRERRLRAWTMTRLRRSRRWRRRCARRARLIVAKPPRAPLLELL
jgi:hypothetical protein